MPDTVMIPVNRTAYVYFCTLKDTDKRLAAAKRYPSYLSRKNNNQKQQLPIQSKYTQNRHDYNDTENLWVVGSNNKKTKPTTAPKRTPRGTVLRLLAFKSKTEKHRADHFL